MCVTCEEFFTVCQKCEYIWSMGFDVKSRRKAESFNGNPEYPYLRGSH